MTDLEERLERLGLSQYLEVLVAEGFDTWDTILDITESDLNSLNFKLGHRRKLQRAIAETRGQSHERPLPLPLGKTSNFDGSYRSDDSASESKPTKNGKVSASATDEHAPERPPSAYVIFSNQMREVLKGQDLSFTEIAKIVGERWQVLSSDAREACERQANIAKEKYYSELAEYKKTPQYEAYQKYLEEFKAKHATLPKEGKRSKLETETSNSTRSSSRERADRNSHRRVSAALSEGFSIGHHRSGSSPPMSYALAPHPPYSTKSTSPTTYSLSGLNSPRPGERYSPMSASPRSATLHKETSFDFHSNAQPRMDPRERHSDPITPLAPSSSFGHGPPQSNQNASTTPPSLGSGGYTSQFHTPIDLPSRRSYRDSSRLPPLTHDDTTLSSESGSIGGYPGGSGPYQGSLLPVVDAPKSMRLLPQPVPTLGAAPSLLDHGRPPLVTPPPLGQVGQLGEFRPTSSLAALLRAGELARVRDREVMPTERDGREDEP
ncbi:hypothetical protein K432DRAFT_406138 [Lepidopterella palustris CBS 459.81]|uniref:HMG box domain-containing protein n=1 Tax=Lepidopterella palustris CBS 459.81 TaxID=1314670 RepID=A0A8E2E7J9_9PEZI|nr:hypothetical protein K432DRAFT_406138 [Lepidopterella palustris CBS 459.81]